MEKVLWTPSRERIESSSLYHYMKRMGWSSYRELHQWSIDNPGDFWQSLFSEFKIIHQGELSPANKDLDFKSYTWFPQVELNFAENLLRWTDKTSPEQAISVAINFQHESGDQNHRKLTYGQLRKETAAFQRFLKEKTSLKQGDVLACYMPNIPETVMAMLATTALGGVFTSTSSDFGVEGVIDRFGQSRPKVLVAACGYEYGGKYFDLIPRLKELERRLPFLEKIVVVDFLNKKPDKRSFSSIMELWGQTGSKDDKGDIEFKRVPFGHPLYIMYSSGTTGKPKCIVHSVGGTLLQHLKELGLHCNVGKNKKI